MASHRSRILACALAMLAGSTAAAATDLEDQQQYARAIMSKVEANWVRPDSVPLEIACNVLVVQCPGVR